jgi:hypothetical protein
MVGSGGQSTIQLSSRLPRSSPVEALENFAAKEISELNGTGRSEEKLWLNFGRVLTKTSATFYSERRHRSDMMLTRCGLVSSFKSKQWKIG